jgi:4-carboxymuconolactone decarboxylase
MTTSQQGQDAMMTALDDATRVLVRAAAVVASGGEAELRAVLATAEREVPHAWIEELLLQTHLFAGFPRALNAFREWRRLVPVPAGPADSSPGPAGWTSRGEITCSAVYGSMYDRLRENIAALHPALDTWMVVDGYGKVLSRPGLDLHRRELCIVAACVATGQERQLHSHLHGAINVGVAPAVVKQALDALAVGVDHGRLDVAHRLLDRVVGK